ncbi:hypothetical protein FB45DRAFT_1058364 [Roridomyces roridus]|uniref:Rap-GAP domain-containing protein n=1 Tax=Roridomyces roridus TaxID=1738132 RepID=A0AAD7FL16_9AGAR|nr:hypothetical protein FB45DRAFT_1058364 [Roridomyces roridus]
MFPNDVDSPRSRPRANTTSFHSFVNWPGRKAKQEQSATPPLPNANPAPLQLEQLIEALTPPAVPSLVYARSLATGLSTHSPIPAHTLLNPILATLCAPDKPVALQCAGYDILSAYCENPDAVALGTTDRVSYFSLFLGNSVSWGTEIWEPRFKALRALTKSGSDCLGIELPVLSVLKAWISSAFDSIVADLALDRSERAERERSVNILAEYLTALVGRVELIARIPETEVLGVLHFYAAQMERAMDLSSLRRPSISSPPFEFVSSPSPSRPPYGQNHRRNPSSVSIASVTSPPVTPGLGTRQPTDIAIAIYINHLKTQLNTLTSMYLDIIIPFLFRALSHCASTLPRLAVTTQSSRQSTSEDKINDTLYSLLAGPYTNSSMMILRKNLYPPPNPETLEPKLLEAAIQTAFGAQRTFRTYVRKALSSRLARAYILSESSNGSYAGVPAHMDLAQEVMERAWPSDAGLGQSGWEAGKLGRPLSRSARDWVAFCLAYSDEGDWHMRESVERILDETAGTLKDVLQELDAREEEDIALTKEEAAAVGETLFNLAEYLLPLKNHDGTPFILPLDRPADAPSTFLRTLTFILSRDHSVELKPLLSTTLLHVADHLADADTAKLPMIMADQSELTPNFPEWLEHWEHIFKNPSLLGAQRPLTRKAVMVALESVHDNIRDMPSYRKPLAKLVMDSCERSTLDPATNHDDGDDCEVMWRVLGEEVVFMTVDNENESSPDLVTKYLELLVTAASKNDDFDDEDFDTASVTTAGTHSPAPYTGLITPSTTASPILSRMQSEFHSSSAGKDKDKDGKDSSGLPSVMSSIISTFTSGNSSRSQSIQPMTLEPRPEDSRTSSPSGPPPMPSDVAATSALILAFSQLVFTPHALVPRTLVLAIRIYEILIKLLGTAKASRIRLTVLQFMVRLRADRDHRVYFVGTEYDYHGLAAMLGSLIQRVASPPEAQSPQQDLDMAAELRLPRARVPHERQPRGRTVASGSSRSRSRFDSTQPPTPTTKVREPLWKIPETLPFTVSDPDSPSERFASYDEGSDSGLSVLPISLYLGAIHDILDKEHNWDVLSYVLCHLPNQLANKHLFCGPKSREACRKILMVLCAGILDGGLGAHVDRWPAGLKARDAHGLAYHTLSVLVSYQQCFDMAQQHLLVEAFQLGLDGQPATIKCCLNALSLAAFELPSSMTKFVSRILEKLSRIMSNADVAVHILGLLSIIGSSRPLYANFTEGDYKMVFGVALQYLQHQNRNREDAQSTSWALSEHVRVLSYYVVYVWFLALKLPDRRKHVRYITRQLLIANEGRTELDGPTEVCFDWLERYTYASADPRPATSFLNEIVMNSPSDEVEEKTWCLGNSFVTVRTLKKQGWFEVLSRRPSGYTKILCRLENIPMVGAGDVDPDILSVPAALMMDRTPARVNLPDDGEDDATAAPPSAENIREVLGSPNGSTSDVPAPDPITGYVWSGTAPSQRRKQVEMDPAFIALQLSERQSPGKHPLCRVQSPNLAKFFTTLDRMPVIDTHKVGIMYVAPGQTTEQEILGNTHGSPAYTRFLKGIGRLINLRGQVDVYAGGLDPDEDGEYAYAWWDDIGQILYHTATMMPNNPDDPQFTNKKRHIGNDLVRIVWNDSGRPYRFDTLNTQFQFINIVIEPHSIGPMAAFSNNHHENEYFKITVQRAPNMPEFSNVRHYELMSTKNLPLSVRQLSLEADWFAHVFKDTAQDTQRVEVSTNWLTRLEAIRRFQKQHMGLSPEVPEPNADIMDQEVYRDFTTSF